MTYFPVKQTQVRNRTRQLLDAFDGDPVYHACLVNPYASARTFAHVIDHHEQPRPLP